MMFRDGYNHEQDIKALILIQVDIDDHIVICTARMFPCDLSGVASIASTYCVVLAVMLHCP